MDGYLPRQPVTQYLNRQNIDNYFVIQSSLSPQQLFVLADGIVVLWYYQLTAILSLKLTPPQFRSYGI